MKPASRTARITCGEGLSWVKDERFTLVVHEERGTVYRLSGFPETLWRYLALSCSYRQLLALTARLWKLPSEEAEAEVQAILHEWSLNGLVELEDGPDG